MKILKSIIFVIIVLSIFSCNNEKKTRAYKNQYTSDYVGKDLTKKQIDSIFKLEEKKYQYAIDNSGKIEIIEPNVSIKQLFEKELKNEITEYTFEKFESVNLDNTVRKLFENNLDKVSEFKINEYNGIKLYSLPKEVFTASISFNDFKNYYLSLTKENQKGVLSTVNHKYFKFIVENQEIQNFLIDEFNKEKKEKKGKKISINKISFFATHKIYLDSISSYLRNIDNNYYHFYNSKFLKVLYDNGKKKEAFDLFVFLMNKTKKNFKTINDKKEFRPYLGSDYKGIYIDFLFDKSSQQKYKEVSIDMIISNSLQLDKTIENIKMLWRSNLLNKKEKKILVEYSKNGVKNNYQYNQTKISRVQNSFNIILADYYGFDYLKNYKSLGHYNSQFNFPLHSIIHLTKYKKLNNQQKTYILDFLKKNFDKINWNYFKSYYSKERLIKNIKNNFLNISNKKSYNTKEIISFLKSINSFDKDNYNKMEREIVKNPFNGYEKNSLQKTVWFMIGKNIPEVGFDTEAGLSVLNYKDMLQPFVQIMKSKLNIEIEIVQLNSTFNDYQSTKYIILIKEKNNKNVYKITIEDSGDWYSPSSLIKVFNEILMKNNLSFRWINLDTGGQYSSYILVELEKYKILNDKYNIKDKYITN